MKPFQLMLAGGFTLMMSGCFHYSCPAPEGTTCKSISEIYEMSNTGALGKKKADKAEDRKTEKKKEKKPVPVALKVAPAESSDEEIKLAPQEILPIKIMKYVDSDGDLHYPGYLFIVISKSPWGNLAGETTSIGILPPTQANASEPEKPIVGENTPLAQNPPANLSASFQNGSALNLPAGGFNSPQNPLAVPTGSSTAIGGGQRP